MTVADYQTINRIFGLEYSKARFAPDSEAAKWFEPDYRIDYMLQSFWGSKTKAKLVAVSKDIDDSAWEGLVSEWDSYTPSPGQFRISKGLVQNLLEESLGMRRQGDKSFNLSKLTDLELEIFENFFVELENFWKESWSIIDPNSSGKSNFLIWLIEFENIGMGALAIGVPPGLFPKNAFDEEDFEVDVEHFVNELDFRIPIDFVVGSTKLTLSDLKSLQIDDILMFENSSADKVWWERNEFENLYIQVELPERDDESANELYYDDIEDMQEMSEDNIVQPNLEDNDILTDLSIELTAQFKSVTLPLKQVMELKSGGVLPLGLLLDSELVLIAAGNKVVAKGELIVIGNQFGLKIKDTKIKSERKIQTTEHMLPPGSVPEAMLPAGEENHYEQAPSEDEQLQKELEEVGLDPDELDELDDLY
jgi:flagellar motor switch/type III secretory pathway protein FliN